MNLLLSRLGESTERNEWLSMAERMLVIDVTFMPLGHTTCESTGEDSNTPLSTVLELDWSETVKQKKDSLVSEWNSKEEFSPKRSLRMERCHDTSSKQL